MAALAFLLLTEGLWLVVLTINRLILLYRFNPPEIWTLYRSDIAPALTRGFLFDLKVIAFLCLPYLILALGSRFLGRDRTLRWDYRLACVLWPLSLLVLVIDHQYYAFFQSHINILVFGVIEDDTRAVLKSVWSDHPVIIWAVVFISVTMMILWVSRRAARQLRRRKLRSPSRVALAFAVYLPLHVLAMRGSLGMMPLVRDDAVVSNHPFLNYLAMNGFFALKEAVQAKADASTFTPERAILDHYQMTSVDAALKILGKRNLDELTTRSRKNPVVEKRPPNVFYVMMESWGNGLFDYHDPQKNDLLSTFAPHYTHDYVFRNFVSSTNATISSLEALLTGKESLALVLWNSIFRFHSLDTALARPFKERGYRTVFITSGKLGWRNSNEWVARQYFDESYGQTEILKALPDAEDCAWGVYDEYSFEFAARILASETTKPLFVFVMTTSNHTPYELPRHFRPAPTQIPAALTNNLITSRDVAERSLQSFQYVNKSLGDFIDVVERDPAHGAQSIIVATGDHNMWTLMPHNSEVIASRFNNSVPLYIHVPAYLRDHLEFDAARPGSHKDIIPTLTELALSDAPYFAEGNNLFGRQTRATYFGVNASANFHPTTYPEADAHLMLAKLRAFYAINEIYFQREFCKFDKRWCGTREQ